MNILLINHYAGTDKYGMEFRPYYLAKNWIKQGHNVKIVASSYSHLRNMNPDVRKNISNEFIDKIEYIWIKTKSYNKNGLKRFMNILEFLIKFSFYRKKILKSFNPDIVIASSTYPIDNYIAKKISRKYKAIHVYEVHDLWPLSLIEIGGMSQNNPFVKLIQYFENYSYKNADYIVSLLSNSKKHMIEHGMSEDKFIFIPNGYEKNTETDKTEKVIEIINTIKDLKGNNFLVGYAGGHSISNALDTLIDVANMCDDKIIFILIGDGIEKEKLKKMVIRDNVLFFDRIPKTDVIHILKEMDCLYIGWRNKSIYKYGISPNKLIDYMKSGKPIIHAVVDCDNDLVTKANCGLTAKADDVSDILKQIRLLKNKNFKELEQIGKNGQTYVEENLSYAKLSRDFISSIHSKRS